MAEIREPAETTEIVLGCRGQQTPALRTLKLKLVPHWVVCLNVSIFSPEGALASSSLSFSFPPSLLPPFPKPRNPGRQGKGYIPILWIWKARLTEVRSFVGSREGRSQWHILGSLILVCVPLPGPVRQVQ